jgi:hypothetical protein
MTTKRCDAFSPDQERDENGRWTSTGSGDKKSEVKKAVGGGYHEIKQNPTTGYHEATHTQGGRTSHMGTYSSPEKAKSAIAAHEAKVKERMATSGANSAKVHNQVTESMMAKREERNAMLGAPVLNKSGRPMSAKASALIRESEARTAALKDKTAALKERSASLRKATREVKAIGKEAERYNLTAGRYTQLVKERQALAKKQGGRDFMGGRLIH